MVSKSVVWLMLELAEIDPAVSIITMARTAAMRLSSGGAAHWLDVGARAEALAAEMLLDQDFGDLDGIECRALAQIVGDDPQIEPMRDRRVAADAADVDGVLAGRLGRGHITLVRAVVDDGDAGRLPQGGARLVLTERPLELDIDRLAMA